MAGVDTRGVTVNVGEAGRSGARPSRSVSLGRGLVVPYPEPTDEAATKMGKANRRTGTKPEIRLRAAVHRRGLRFRKDLLVRAGDVKVRPDIVFPRAMVAVFVDGCFWHGCPDHQHVPRRNRAYWIPKLRANVERDHRVDVALSTAGWHVERIWEHEEVATVAGRIEHLVRSGPMHVSGGGHDDSPIAEPQRSEQGVRRRPTEIA